MEPSNHQNEVVRSRFRSLSENLEGLQSTTPPLLYHYTTPQALCGIIETGSLWATDVRFMNDATELQYANRILTATTQSAIHDVKQDEQNIILKSILRDLELTAGSTMNVGSRSLRYFSVYAACCSERKDDLANWRAYAGTMGGFAIELDLSRTLPPKPYDKVYDNLMRELKSGEAAVTDVANAMDKYAEMTRREYLLIKVIYDESEQVRLMKSVLDTCLELLDVGYGIREVKRAAWEVMWKLLLSFKHPKFAVEAEWRLVVNEMAVDLRNRFRDTARALREKELMSDRMRSMSRLDLGSNVAKILH